MSQDVKFEQPWTEPEIVALIRLWNSGHTASEITNVLPHRKRNSIIGKVTRLRDSPSTAHLITRPVKRMQRLMGIKDRMPRPFTATPFQRNPFKKDSFD